MAKIGIDIRSIGKKRTGDEVVFFNLVKNLAGIDAENEYFLFTDIKDIAVMQNIVAELGIGGKDNFKIIQLKSINKFTWNIWTLPKYLRKNPLHIYHTQYITPFFVPKRTKIITIVHDLSFNFFPQFIKLTDLFFLKTLIPMSLKRADKIIAVSQFTRNEIIKYYNIIPEKVDCVHNAISSDFSEKSFTLENLDEIRKKYDLPGEFILYLGTMQPRKNLTTLIEAYARINEKFPEVKLVLVGGKNAYNFDKEIGKAIHKFSLSADVIFAGFVPENEKSAFFKLARVFCFPSFYEGFGIPILEAMAEGTPVIASNIPAHREVAGEAALFFNPAEPEELFEKLNFILRDESARNEIIQKGREQIRRFSWTEAARKTLSIYKSLIID